MASRFFLFNFPSEILESVVDKLQANEVYRLWKSGSLPMRANLTRAVRSLRMEEGTLGELTFWPRVITYFPHLKHLELYISDEELNECQLVSELSLEVLQGLPLESLKMTLPRTTFLKQYLPKPSLISQEGSKPPFKEILPHLKSLIIEGAVGGFFQVSTKQWLSFPSDLEVLQWRQMRIKRLPDLASILPSLIELRLNQMELGENTSLPPSLTRLAFNDFHSQSTPLEHDSGLRMKWHFPDVRHLSIKYPDWSSVAIWSLFPRLETLKLPTGFSKFNVDEVKLPSTLHTFKSSTKISPEFAALLPRGITRLHCGNLSYSQETLLPLFKALPPSLRDLQLEITRTPVASRTWTDEELELLPKTLTNCTCLSQLRWTPTQTIKRFFPNLKILTNFENGPHLTLSNLLDLPQSLVTIRLDPRAEAHEDSSTFNAVIRAMPNLKAISLTPMSRFQVVDHASLLRSLGQNLVNGTVPPSWGLLPIAGTGPESWIYWMADIQHKYEQHAQSTPLDVSTLDLTAIYRLDLGLPRALRELSVNVSNHMGSVQPLTILFDEEFTLAKDDTQQLKPQTEANGRVAGLDDGNIGVSRGEYFSNLTFFTIEKDHHQQRPIQLVMGISPWPSSLVHIYMANSPVQVELGRFLQFVPNTLQCLGVNASDITDDDILNLPRFLKTLTVNSFPKGRLASYKPEISFGNFPKLLTYISIPSSQACNIDEQKAASLVYDLPPALTALHFTPASRIHWFELYQLRRLALLEGVIVQQMFWGSSS